MNASTQATSNGTERKRKFLLEKRNGDTIPFTVPEHFTVGQAKNVLAERCGYEPNFAEDPASVRLAEKSEAGTRLLPDETTFRELAEGICLKPIPSLSPAQ